MIKNNISLNKNLFKYSSSKYFFDDKDIDYSWKQEQDNIYNKVVSVNIPRNGLNNEYLMTLTDDNKLKDTSVNLKHGILNNIILSNNNFCDFIELDGSTSYVNCEKNIIFNSLNVGSAMSLSVWIYAYDAMASYGAIFSKNLAIRFSIKSGQIAIHGGDNYGDGFAWGADALGKISINQWHHIVFVLRPSEPDGGGTVAYAYIDSIFTGSTTTYGLTTEDYDVNAYIGSLNGTSNFFNGKISKLRIYNKELSQNEINRLYNEIPYNNKINDMCKIFYTMNSIIDTTVYDEIGIKNATAVDISPVEGKYGNAASFNGSSSRINLDGITFTNDKLSLSMWIKTSAAASVDKYLFDSNLSRFIFAWNTGGGGGTGKFGIYSVSSWHQLNTSAPNDNNWHHICLVINKTLAKLYIDGINVEDETIDAIDLSSSTDTTIGCSYSELLAFFDGAIDYFRIYEKALSADEVLYLYNM